MDTPTDPRGNLPADEHGLLACDCHCVRCGYNLRGLSPASICPECATPIGRSVHGDHLQFSDPAWVEKLASGMNWVAVGVLLGIGFFVVFICAGVAVTQTGRFQGMMVVRTLVLFGIHLISLVGYWKVTTPDPAAVCQESGLTARRIVRIWAVSTQALIPVYGPLESISSDALTIVQIISEVWGIIGTIAMFTYAGRLAMRIPDLTLARQTRTVMWGLVICTGLGAVSTYLGPPGAAAPPAATRPTATLPAGSSLSTVELLISGGLCVVGLGMLIFGLWTIVLVLRYRNALNRCAEMARATWAGTAG